MFQFFKIDASECSIEFNKRIDHGVIRWRENLDEILTKREIEELKVVRGKSDLESFCDSSVAEKIGECARSLHADALLSHDTLMPLVNYVLHEKMSQYATSVLGKTKLTPVEEFIRLTSDDRALLVDVILTRTVSSRPSKTIWSADVDIVPYKMNGDDVQAVILAERTYWIAKFDYGWRDISMTPMALFAESR